VDTDARRPLARRSRAALLCLALAVATLIGLCAIGAGTPEQLNAAIAGTESSVRCDG
jgi:hypothetical protein